MIITGYINHVLAKHTHVCVLRQLVMDLVSEIEAEETTIEEFTGFERLGGVSSTAIADATGLNRVGVITALKELSGLGVVKTKTYGRANRHRLNEKWIGFRSLFDLYVFEINVNSMIVEAIVEELELCDPSVRVDAIILYGSQAKGAASVGSDYDICVVMDGKLPKGLHVADLRDDLMCAMYEKWELPVDPLFYTPKELRALHKKKDPLIRTILDEGQFLYGLSKLSLLSNA